MLSNDQIRSLQMNASAPRPTTGRAKFINGQFVLDEPSSTQKKKKGFLLDNLSTGGSLAGALAGGAAGTAILPGVGTVIGAILGGAAGGGGGQVAENAIAGDKLDSDVASEALWGGATALPIGSVAKLGKAGGVLVKGLGKDAARVAAKDLVMEAGVKAMPKKAVQALTISDALKSAPAREAAERLATAPSIGQKVAKNLSGAGDDLALKNFKINGSEWINNFTKNIGEDPGAFAKRLNLVGKSPGNIVETVYKPMQDIYHSHIASLAPISKEEIAKELKSVYSPLLKDSALENQALGSKIKRQAEEVLKGLPDSVDAPTLNEQKSKFAGLVDQKLSDRAGKLSNDVNNRIAESFRKVLNDAFDSSGIKLDPSTLPPGVKSTDLRGLGKELQGVSEFADEAAKKANVGRGKSPFGLGQLQGIIVGSQAGGIPGAIAGGATQMAINSNTGRRALMNATEKAASKLSRQPSRTLGESLKQAAMRIGGAGVARSALGGQSSDLPNSSESTDMNATAAMIPTSVNMAQSYTQQPQQSNPFGRSSSEIGQALMRAYSVGDTAAAKQLEGMYQLASQFEQDQAKATAVKPMSAEAAKQLANAQTALEALDTIESTISNDPSAQKKSIIPGSAGGGLAGALLGTGQYEAARQQAIDVIGRLRSGGAIQADEERRFRAFLPQPYDNAETTKYKLGQLRNAFMTLAAGVAGNTAEDTAAQTVGY